MPITQGIAGHVASTGKAYNKYHTYQAKSRLLFIKNLSLCMAELNLHQFIICLYLFAVGHPIIKRERIGIS
jgi:hypothetical protein